MLANHMQRKRKEFNFLPTNTNHARHDIRLVARLGIPGWLVDAGQTESTMFFHPFLEEAHYTPDRLYIEIILIMFQSSLVETPFDIKKSITQPPSLKKVL